MHRALPIRNSMLPARKTSPVFVKQHRVGRYFRWGAGKKAPPQNRSAADWGIDVVVALVAFAFGCAQMVITASSVVHVDAGPAGRAGLITSLIFMRIWRLPLRLRR